MFDIDILYNKINVLKTKNKKVYSNCFLSYEKLKSISGSNNVHMEMFEDCILVFLFEDTFYRMYFYINCIEHLHMYLEMSKILKITKYPVITELVGREYEIKQFECFLSEYGFVIYDKLSQWRASSIICNDAKIFINDIKFDYALSEDSLEINNLLLCNLDKYVSHLPNIMYIKKLIENHLVYIAKKDKKIIGVILFESIGRFGKYLYQILVSNEYRGQKIGWEFAKFAFASYKDNNNFTSWVSDKNEVSELLHLKLGMSKNDLKTIVLMYKKGE